MSVSFVVWSALDRGTCASGPRGGPLSGARRRSANGAANRASGPPRRQSSGPRERTPEGLTSPTVGRRRLCAGAPTPEKGSAMARYSADHVGSFLRPPELLQARVAHDEGRIDEVGLRAAEERAIAAVLDLQRQAGVDVYSDGEYRRAMWLTGLPAAVDGFGPGAMLNIRRWRGRALPYA